MHNVFISYHHGNDQYYKNQLSELNQYTLKFWDRSVRDGDISDDLSTQTIRRLIRDRWLRNSTVTILLVGKQTSFRKHVDWELKSSMIDGSVNKKSGILVISLPGTEATPPQRGLFTPQSYLAPKTRKDFELRYPYMPPRIIDNLVSPNVEINIVPYNSIINNPTFLSNLISRAHQMRTINKYDLSRKMRMHDHNPALSLYDSL